MPLALPTVCRGYDVETELRAAPVSRNYLLTDFMILAPGTGI